MEPSLRDTTLMAMVAIVMVAVERRETTDEQAWEVRISYGELVELQLWNENRGYSLTEAAESIEEGWVTLDQYREDVTAFLEETKFGRPPGSNPDE